MIHKVFLLTCLIAIMPVSFSLGVSDFVPGYLVSDNGANSGADPTVPVKPLVNTTRNTTQVSDNDWYCNGGSSTDSNVANNVFCDKSVASGNEKVVTFESNSSGNIGGKMVDNSVGANGNILSQPSSNQQTMQDQQVRNTINRTQNGFTVPIQPSDDVKVNINQQQIQLNIQY